MKSLFLIGFIAKKIREAGRKNKFLRFVRVIALLSVVLGNLALIISLSILSGYEKHLKEKASNFCAHILVYNLYKNPLLDYKQIIDNIKSVEGVANINACIEKEVLISSKTDIQGVLIRSIAGTNFSKFSVVEGTSEFSGKGRNEIIISRRLADNLNLKVGDKVIIYSIPREKQDIYSPNISQLEVIGIYNSGLAKYDDIYVFAQDSTIANIFSMPVISYNLIEVYLKDMKLADKVAPVINEILGFKYITTTIYELNSSMFNWIELQKEPIPIVLGLISIVAIANIITVLLILVVEKTYTIGILRALGLTAKEIVGVFITEGLLIGFLGSIIGCFLGFIFSILQSNFHIIRLKGEIYFLEFLPIEINILHYIIVFGITIGVTFLATLIPSFSATRISEIKAIRFS